LRADAEDTYNEDRKKDFPDKSLYISKFELDLLEHCIFYLIASKNGYKFEFYPGKIYSSIDFFNNHFLDEIKIIRVNVTLRSPRNINSE
jgi:nucleosome binding factor SPN SPT16 subunit